MHEGVVPADMEALRLGDLALGDEPKLGVSEGVEGQAADPQEPRAKAALDLKAHRALGTRHPAFALDPQLPVDAAQVPRPMLDPCRGPYALKEQARVSVMGGRGDLKHWCSIVTNAMKVICSHDEIGRTIFVLRLKLVSSFF
jgi:hypothetical protein